MSQTRPASVLPSPPAPGVPGGDPRGAVLLGLARETIGAALGLVRPQPRDAPWLRDQAATFVTLHRDGELRGCIGTIDPVRPLAQDVAHNARAAAFEDPRFPPLGPEEFASLQVEVSLLSPRAPLEVHSEAEALARLRPGVDGVLLEHGRARATFLPQVWESLPDPLVFLSELRRKAGLPPRFWHPDLRLSRYTVEKFSEPAEGP